MEIRLKESDELAIDSITAYVSKVEK